MSTVAANVMYKHTWIDRLYVKKVATSVHVGDPWVPETKEEKQNPTNIVDTFFEGGG